MKKQIKHISIHQSSKTISILYFLISLIIFIPFSFVVFFYGEKEQAFSYLIFPFFYLFGTYIVFAILSWLYNRIANVFGGVEVTIENIEDDKK